MVTQPTPTGPNAPKLWRSTIKRRASSVDSATSSVEAGYTFGLKAPIVDFFDNDYITKFASLEDVLLGKADEIMTEAYKADPMEETYLPWTANGYNFRWIHIPANNMVWVEEIIRKVCESKGEQYASGKFKGNKKKIRREPLKAGNILSDDYWKDQQRGCVKHCANNPLYARHMVPFFAEIPADWDTATASIVAPVPEPVAAEDLSGNRTPVSPRPMPYLQTAQATSEPSVSAQVTAATNMVLFMPYLHWATCGDDFDHRNAVIKELTERFKDPGYRKPSVEDIEALGETTNMKLIRAFLEPKNDRCLHIRRTLDQYYYSTSIVADERTIDQIVYKFAMKQHRKKLEDAERAEQENKIRDREWRKKMKWETTIWETGESSTRSSRSRIIAESDPTMRRTRHESDERRDEAPWDPPKVIMVNQLWMWIIDGDTVITSFPSKSRSNLSVDDRVNAKDYMEGDDIYDSSDIWRAVQRELRHKTTYGQRTAKSALDLAWTIADQARGVFQKRNLHPHLQFLQIFEMEINEIKFRQQAVFASFSQNVKAVQNSNNMVKLLSLLSNFRTEHISTTETQIWKDDFRVFAIDFKIKFNRTVSAAQSQAKAQGRFWPALVDSSGGSIVMPKSSTDVLDGQSWEAVLKYTYTQLHESLDNATLINLTYEAIEAQVLDSLISSFIGLEAVVRTVRSTDFLTKLLNNLITVASKSIDWYTERATENLFDFTTEADLMTEIKDVLDELNIISSIARQQATVIKPFMRDILNQPIDTEDKSFYDSGKIETHIEELQKTAKSTYAALQHQLDLKQKQISVVEARAARKEARASADQAATFSLLMLLNTETVKQGWAIMIFTIVTIIFLPLSFFTGLFGMNAKELLSAQYSMGFYSKIMYPVSFVVTAVSLGLALNPEFHVFLRHATKKMSSLTWWLDLPGWLWMEMGNAMRRFRDNHKWDLGARVRERKAQRMNERDIVELERGRGAL